MVIVVIGSLLVVSIVSVVNWVVLENTIIDIMIGAIEFISGWVSTLNEMLIVVVGSVRVSVFWVPAWMLVT